MINSVQGGFAGPGGIPPRPPSAPLTDEQKTQVADILSDYDAENLTAEDKKEINEAFKEAGIRPGEDLKNAIETAGFDAKDLRPQREEGNRPPPPPPPQGIQDNQNSQIAGLLQDFVSQYQSGEVSEEDVESFVNSLQEQGFGGRNGLLVDQSA